MPMVWSLQSIIQQSKTGRDGRSSYRHLSFSRIPEEFDMRWFMQKPPACINRIGRVETIHWQRIIGKVTNSCVGIFVANEPPRCRQTGYLFFLWRAWLRHETCPPHRLKGIVMLCTKGYALRSSWCHYGGPPFFLRPRTPLTICAYGIGSPTTACSRSR